MDDPTIKIRVGDGGEEKGDRAGGKNEGWKNLEGARNLSCTEHDGQSFWGVHVLPSLSISGGSRRLPAGSWD